MFRRSVQTAPYDKSFYALGTIDQLVASGRDSGDAVDAAMRRIYEIDYRMSCFRDDSEIAEINRNAGVSAVAVNSDTFFVIKKAIAFAEQTGGCIDVTVGAILRLWDEAERTGTSPHNSELGRMLRLVNYRDILLGSGKFSVRLNYPGQAIDLGALAKGYAADEVEKIFRHHKVRDALIDLGGSLIAMGARPDGRPWSIGIQHPDRPRGTFIGSVRVTDRAVVTAGNPALLPVRGDRRHSRIIDIKTGYPAQSGLRSVTVISGSSLDACALSTAAYILGLTGGKKLIEATENTEAVFITDDNMVCVTDGLKENFTLALEKPGEAGQPVAEKQSS